MNTKRVRILLVIVVLLSQCKPADKESMMVGNWQVDSIYTFYNGFDFMRHDVDLEPQLDFKMNRLGTFTLGTEQRSFRYSTLIPDSLKLLSEDSTTVISEYKIQQLTPRSMVLRQEKRTLFKEKNQDRYEIRYLSKTSD